MWFIFSAGSDPVIVIVIQFLDLWELPQPRLTNSITANLERNFYSRCPSNKRPAFIHPLPLDTPLSDSDPGKTESVNAFTDEKGEKPGNAKPSNPEQSTMKSREKYDESLFKALHHTFFKRIWGSAILLVISGNQTSTFQNIIMFCNINVRDRHAQNDHASIKPGPSQLAHPVLLLFSPVGLRTNSCYCTPRHWIWYWSCFCSLCHARLVLYLVTLYLLYNTCSIESASVVGRIFIYHYSIKPRTSRWPIIIC